MYLRLGRLSIEKNLPGDYSLNKGVCHCLLLSLGRFTVTWLSSNCKYSTFFEFWANVYDKIAPIGYMCAVDFRHELGEGPTCQIYSSVKSLKEAMPCVEQCGIVEVRVTKIRMAQEENYPKYAEEQT